MQPTRWLLTGLALIAATTVAFAAASSAGPSRYAGAAEATPDTTQPAANPGGIGLRLLDVPVATRDDPRAQVYIVDHLAPGTVIHRRVEVSNTSAASAGVSLYSAAATIGQGSFMAAAGQTRNELSSWTSVSPPHADVPAGATVTAEVDIAIPADASPGERYGVVWAEVRSAPVADGGGAAGGVTQVSRVGIRLYVSVGPGGAPAADFTIDSLTATRSGDGQPTVLATVHNTGGRALDMAGTLQLSDGPSGLSAGPVPATVGSTLAIGDTEPVTISLDKALPAGPWNAQITLHSGLVERSAHATITFPDHGAAPVVLAMASPLRTPDAFRYLDVAAVGVLLLALAFVSVLLHQRRRRPHRGT